MTKKLTWRERVRRHLLNHKSEWTSEVCTKHVLDMAAKHIDKMTCHHAGEMQRDHEIKEHVLRG